ncbi:MAG: M50 family metallopeptidase [Actinomycetota bacterium]|jgi:regulator of sigma E protease|nr:M50 family metallopeptidase [Actinomycetota bacterium]
MGFNEAGAVIFWGVVTFSLLVVIHEGGHFVMAKLFGIKVHEFMIGLPGPAIRIKRKGTDFGITAIPLGGYVRIAGMEPGREDELLAPALKAAAMAGQINADSLSAVLDVPTKRAMSILVTLADWGAIEPATDDRISYVSLVPAERAGDEAQDLLDTARSVTYRGAKTWQRISVLAMGIILNLLTALIVFTVVLSAWGTYDYSLTISGTMPGTPAQVAGLQEGDTLVSLDGVEFDEWLEFINAIAAREPGESVRVGYVRNGTPRDVIVNFTESEDGMAYLGVSSTVTHQNLSVLQAAGESVRWTGYVFVAIVDFFNPETFSRSVEGARGVIGISVEAAQAVENGPLDYAWLIALLSLSLGVMNLLPIPPLDGGKILLELVEWVIRRPIDRRVYLGFSLSGAILLFSFIGYIMYTDVIRYFGAS